MSNGTAICITHCEWWRVADSAPAEAEWRSCAVQRRQIREPARFAQALRASAVCLQDRYESAAQIRTVQLNACHSRALLTTAVGNVAVKRKPLAVAATVSITERRPNSDWSHARPHDCIPRPIIHRSFSTILIKVRSLFDLVKYDQEIDVSVGSEAFQASNCVMQGASTFMRGGLQGKHGQRSRLSRAIPPRAYRSIIGCQGLERQNSDSRKPEIQW